MGEESKLDKHLKDIEDAQNVGIGVKATALGLGSIIGAVTAASNFVALHSGTRVVQFGRRYWDAIEARVAEHRGFQQPINDGLDLIVDQGAKKMAREGHAFKGESIKSYAEAKVEAQEAMEALKNLFTKDEMLRFAKDNKALTTAAAVAGVAMGANAAYNVYKSGRDAKDQQIGKSFRKALAESGTEYATAVKSEGGKNTPEGKVLGKFTERVSEEAASEKIER